MQPGASPQTFTFWSLAGKFWTSEMSAMWSQGSEVVFNNSTTQNNSKTTQKQLKALELFSPFLWWCFISSCFPLVMSTGVWRILSLLFDWSIWDEVYPLLCNFLASSITQGPSAHPELVKQLVVLLPQLFLARSKQCATCRNTDKQHLCLSYTTVMCVYSLSSSLGSLLWFSWGEKARIFIPAIWIGKVVSKLAEAI